MECIRPCFRCGLQGCIMCARPAAQPAHQRSSHCMAQVNGQATPNLDAFQAAVAGLEDGAFVRVKLVHLESAQPKVLTLKMDLKVRAAGGWGGWGLCADGACEGWLACAAHSHPRLECVCLPLPQAEARPLISLIISYPAKD